MAKQTDLNPLGYTPEKAADKLSLSAGVVRKMIYTGQIPAIKIGKRWIIPARALENWIDQKMQE